jgi:SpoVK/Ycf46/Vps4 family AAA+-type ATPase
MVASSTSSGFSNNLEHIITELNRMDLKLRLHILRTRQDIDWKEDELRGLYISEKEISSRISDDFKVSPDISSNLSSDPLYKSLLEELTTLDKQIDAKKAEAFLQGKPLRLERLKEIFSLNSFDKDVLLLCLLPELDVKYERLFGYAQDDVTKRRPTIALATDLLCSSLEDKLATREAFSPQSALIINYLLRFDEDPSAKAMSLAAKALKIDERILNYLLESDQIDYRLLPFTSLSKSQLRLADVIQPDAIKNRLVQLIQSRNGGLVFYFQGSHGVGKQTTAEALCQDFGCPLLVIDVSRLLAEETNFEMLTQLIFREAKLLDAAIFWDNFDLLLAEDKKLCLNDAIEGLRNCSYLNFLAGELPWGRGHILHGTPFVDIKFPNPSYVERKKLWEVHLNSHFSLAPDIDLATLSNKFLFTGGQIRDAVTNAQNLARWRASEELSMDDLYTACRSQSNRKLNTLAHKIESKYTWADIILPGEQMIQLREVTNYVKYRQLVYGEWNFNQKLSLGKGLNVLFAGPSGTGKTMAAGIMANELKLDIYKIDLSTVVSKYIGETEKNLSKIFEEAETSNAILFFDEADALFGKRSEVRDSHDRYANIEIAYLLQRMEEYEGVVILATNLRKNMDEAFVRRMHFIVEFPSPEEEHRYQIWMSIFPTEAPLSNSVDFEFLARQFKITGGNIKNIALNAAFLAADSGDTITMDHLILATRREFQKMGKLCLEADFGKYRSYS